MTAGATTRRPVSKVAGHQTHPNRPLLYILIGLMQLFWAASLLICKVALREFPPSLLASLRVLLAASILLPICLSRGWPHWSRRDLPVLLLLGVFGGAINQSFFVLGLSRTSVGHSSLIIGMMPVWALLLAAWRGLEKITPRKLGGMLAALAGVLMLNLDRGSVAGPTLAGDLITLGGSISFALYMVLGKEISHRYGTLAVNSFVLGSGAVLLLPVAVWQGWSFPFQRISAAGWLGLGYMAVFPSVVCYLIFYYALRYIAASRLAALAYLQPPTATLASVLLLGEPLSAPLVVGGVIILAGVYWAERAR